MSALDKAFLKAYKKDVEPQPATVARAAAADSAKTAAWVDADSLPMLVGVCQSGIVHRVDGAHVQNVDTTLVPHVQFTEFGESPPVAGVSSAPPQALAPPSPTLAPRTSHLAPPRPELQKTLQSAAAVRMPPALELPTLFQSPPPAAEVAAAEADEFLADWEVDRLTWPAMCDRLLQTQARYFQHVGQRLKAATEENPHVLLITGSRRGEGRTTLTMCLARCAASAGVRVALIDADLQHPELGSRLGIDAPISWPEVVAGQAALTEAAVASLDEHITVFPLAAAEHADRPSGDARLRKLLEDVSARFPLVIVDSGPVTAEGRHVCAGDSDCPVDTAIVVRDLRHTTEKRALATAQALQHCGIQAVGVAENFGAES